MATNCRFAGQLLEECISGPLIFVNVLRGGILLLIAFTQSDGKVHDFSIKKINFFLSGALNSHSTIDRNANKREAHDKCG
jgi:hypothetical protein